MSDRSRIRNCYRLCQSTIRNAAYYRGAASLGSFDPSNQFAVTARNNFLEMAFLDWCKLFSEKRGKHHWSKILPDEPSFMSALLSDLAITEAQFKDFTQSVAHYRDKVIAHADIYDVIDIPKLDTIISSTIYLYEKLREHCGCEPTPAAPDNLKATFLRVQNEGSDQFERLIRH